MGIRCDSLWNGKILEFMIQEVFGHLPFDGETSTEIITNILNYNYASIKELPISSELKDLLMRILNPNYIARITVNRIL